MSTLKVRNGAWVLVADGRKCLVLCNEGDTELLNLRQVSVREEASPPTREQGSDKPGRTHQSVGARRGSVSQADWHVLDEQHFAATIAADLNRAVQDHRFKHLVVVAPPKALAELRRDFSPELQATIVAELDKDLTHHPIEEIERLLAAQET